MSQSLDDRDLARFFNGSASDVDEVLIRLTCFIVFDILARNYFVVYLECRRL